MLIFLSMIYRFGKIYGLNQNGTVYNAVLLYAKLQFFFTCKLKLNVSHSITLYIFITNMQFVVYVIILLLVCIVYIYNNKSFIYIYIHVRKAMLFIMKVFISIKILSSKAAVLDDIYIYI